VKTQTYEVQVSDNGSWRLVASGINNVNAVDNWITLPGKRYRVYQLNPRMLVSELTA